MGRQRKNMKSLKVCVLSLALFISLTFGDDSGSASASSSEELMSGESGEMMMSGESGEMMISGESGEMMMSEESGENSSSYTEEEEETEKKGKGFENAKVQKERNDSN